MSSKTAHNILEDPDFQSLARQKRTISTILTIVELTLYFGFIALIAFNKPFLSGQISGDSATTIGIPIAVGVILLSWVLTGIYVYWANTSYDALVRRVREKIGA
jgi:uncharacterized membrane protein (DUF485 family)